MRRPTANNLFEAADDLYSRMAEQGVELPRPANRPGGLRPFALSLWQHLSTVEQHGLPRPGDADPALLRFLTAAWTAVEGAELEKAQGPFGRTTSIASPAGVVTHSDPEGDLTASEILALLKTVDGPGSGLDADLLDGLEAAAFLLLAGGTMAGAIAMGGSKVTGAGAATANGDLVRYEQLLGVVTPTELGYLAGVTSGIQAQINARGSKAWIDFDGTGTIAIRDSENVTSITDNGVGDYTITWTTAFANANYAALITLGGNQTVGTAPYTQITAQVAGSVRFLTAMQNAGAAAVYDELIVNCAAFGDQ